MCTLTISPSSEPPIRSNRSNPNFVVLSVTLSLTMKWMRSRALLIWQKTVSRFSRPDWLSGYLWNTLEDVINRREERSRNSLAQSICTLRRSSLGLLSSSPGTRTLLALVINYKLWPLRSFMHITSWSHVFNVICTLICLFYLFKRILL